LIAVSFEEIVCFACDPSEREAFPELFAVFGVPDDFEPGFLVLVGFVALLAVGLAPILFT
jgi:hypothetical protein